MNSTGTRWRNRRAWARRISIELRTRGCHRGFEDFCAMTRPAKTSTFSPRAFIIARLVRNTAGMVQTSRSTHRSCSPSPERNIMRLFLFLAAAALIAAAAYAAPADATDLRSRPAATGNRLRLVCDQYCQCWQTRYQMRSDGRDYRDLHNFISCPGGGYYNGYYRAGPSIGLGFESRFPVYSHPFPF